MNSPVPGGAIKPGTSPRVNKKWLLSMLKRLYHFTPLFRALRIVWAASASEAMALCFIAMLESLLPLVTVYWIKLTIDLVTEAVSAADKGPYLLQLLLFVGIIGLAVLAQNALASLHTLLNERLSLKTEDAVSDHVHAKSVQLDLQYYENADYFDVLHRAQQGAVHRPANAFANLLLLGQNSLSMVGMLALLLTFHWAVSLLLIVAVIPGAVFRLMFSQRLYKWDRAQTATQRHANYFHFLLTSDFYAKELRLFHLGPIFIKRFHELRQQLRDEKLSIARRRSVAEILAHLVTAVTVYGSFGFMAVRALYGYITVGDLVMYYQAFQRGMNFFKNILSSGASLYEDSLYLTNLFEFLNLQPAVRDPEQPKPAFQKITRGIEIRNLSFRYPGSTRPVLDRVSFKIAPGEHIAIVGENGAGKTTLIKLLCRLYDPDEGAIEIDGVDLRSFKMSELRRQISAVFQDFVRYHLQVRENIWIGNTELDLSSPRIIETARQADIDEAVRSLSQGYETMLGKMFEQGEELSIGEWQKIALARAFLRDAPIIILDEPTSALDARSEYKVFKIFRQLAQGKTAVLISHRLSTAKLADRIIVLHDGKIAEIGTHNELMARDGLYAAFFKMQADYYSL